MAEIRLKGFRIFLIHILYTTLPNSTDAPPTAPLPSNTQCSNFPLRSRCAVLLQLSHQPSAVQRDVEAISRGISREPLLPSTAAAGETRLQQDPGGVPAEWQFGAGAALQQPVPARWPSCHRLRSRASSSAASTAAELARRAAVPNRRTRAVRTSWVVEAARGTDTDSPRARATARARGRLWCPRVGGGAYTRAASRRR